MAKYQVHLYRPIVVEAGSEHSAIDKALREINKKAGKLLITYKVVGKEEVF